MSKSVAYIARKIIIRLKLFKPICITRFSMNVVYRVLPKYPLFHFYIIVIRLIFTISLRVGAELGCLVLRMSGADYRLDLL